MDKTSPLRIDRVSNGWIVVAAAAERTRYEQAADEVAVAGSAEELIGIVAKWATAEESPATDGPVDDRPRCPEPRCPGPVTGPCPVCGMGN